MARKETARNQSAYSKTPKNASSKADDIREMDTRKFLYTNISEYLDKSKKQNCTTFKEFLQENKKVLQFKY